MIMTRTFVSLACQPSELPHYWCYVTLVGATLTVAELAFLDFSVSFRYITSPFWFKLSSYKVLPFLLEGISIVEDINSYVRTHTLHSRTHTLHSRLHTFHSRRHNLHSSLHILHSRTCTLHFGRVEGRTRVSLNEWCSLSYRISSPQACASF